MTLEIGKDINRSFAKFFSGKIIDSIIVAIITFYRSEHCGYSLYGIDQCVLIGVTNIIPFLGSISEQFQVLLVFLVDPVKGIIFVILIIIILQVDGNIIGPKIIGRIHWTVGSLDFVCDSGVRFPCLELLE